MTVEEITAAMNAEDFEMTQDLRETILNDYKASAEALANVDETTAKKIEELTKERDAVREENEKIKRAYADKFGSPGAENDFDEKLESEVLEYFKNKI